MERRRLVGRRYEDYLRNNIVIELTPDEVVWRTVLCDPRYNPLMERRKTVRRKTDLPQEKPFMLLKPECSFTFMEDFMEV